MPQIMVSLEPECDIPIPGIFHFFGGIGTGIGKIWYQKKVSEPVSVKFGIGKKSWNWYQKNLVPTQVPVLVSKTFGTGKKYRYRYRLTFLVPSHTDWKGGSSDRGDFLVQWTICVDIKLFQLC